MNFLQRQVLQKPLGIVAEVPLPETVKRAAEGTKDKMPVPAAVFVPDLKAVKFRCTADFPKEVSTIFLQSIMLH